MKIKRFIQISVGTIIMGLGLYFFLIPANLAVGGVTGLAMVIQTHFHLENIGWLIGMLNVILLIIGYILFGKEFCGYTIYSSLLLSGTIAALEWVIPLKEAIVNELSLNLVYGIIIQAVGFGIIFHNNASTGGTDIIAKILNRYIRIDMGKSLFLSDAIITLMAGLIFGKVLGLYAFLGILLNGLVIDQIMITLTKRHFILLISQKSDEITSFIHKTLDRGVTHFHGSGAYHHNSMDMIGVVLTKTEYFNLKQYIECIDPCAFLIVSHTSEVIGNGFSSIHS